MLAPRVVVLRDGLVGFDKIGDPVLDALLLRWVLHADTSHVHLADVAKVVLVPRLEARI